MLAKEAREITRQANERRLQEQAEKIEDFFLLLIEKSAASGKHGISLSVIREKEDLKVGVMNMVRKQLKRYGYDVKINHIHNVNNVEITFNISWKDVLDI